MLVEIVNPCRIEREDRVWIFSVREIFCVNNTLTKWRCTLSILYSAQSTIFCCEEGLVGSWSSPTSKFARHSWSGCYEIFNLLSHECYIGHVCATSSGMSPKAFYDFDPTVFQMLQLIGVGCRSEVLVCATR